MFHMNEGGCALVLQKDLEYWIIGNLVGSNSCHDDCSPVYTPCINSFEEGEKFYEVKAKK